MKICLETRGSRMQANFTYRVRTFLLSALLVISGGLAHCNSSPVAAQESENAATTALDAAQILEQQQIIAGQFAQLEEKLFELYQLERETRPQRAELLRQMYQWSQSRDMSGRLTQIVQWVEGGELRLAQQAQQETLDDLKALMEILQKEDQAQNAEEEKKRLQENLKEVKRLLQVQSILQQKTRQADAPAELGNEQHQLAEETEALNGRIEAQKSAQENQESREMPGDLESRESEAQESQSENSENGSPSSEEAEKPPGAGEQGKEGTPSGDSSDGDSSDGEPADSSSQPEPSTQDDPLNQQLQKAAQRMKQAEQKLRDAEKNGAIEEMQEAIEQLEAAREELEKILRQTREEEMMSTLARLEDQFRKMLESQLRVNQQTLQLDQVPGDLRGPDHEIGAAKLAGLQRKNGMAALRATMILREDATSIALAVTVEQMQEDMTWVADALVKADTGKITQQVELDVVETLETLLESVVQAQEDLQEDAKQKPSEAGESQQPGEMPLVDQIAELKMLRGMQERILKRHRLLATEAETMESPLGRLGIESAQNRLMKLESQQQRLFEITREMIQHIR